MSEKPVCSICQDEYDGYGNNADPVNDGRCCDVCNSEIVVPARITIIYRRRNVGKEHGH